MNAETLLAEAHRLGITLFPAGDKLRVDAPKGALSPDLRQALADHKPEILALLKPVSDGERPPLDRPPENEVELRRLIDWLADPVAFARWLERLMDREE